MNRLLQPSRTTLAIFTATLASCTALRGPQFATEPHHTKATRQPDGALFDNDSPPPTSQITASTNGHVVSLKEPTDTALATHTVRAFFQAISQKNTQLLSSTITPAAQAFFLDSDARAPLARHWSRRFSKYAYEEFANDPPYVEHSIETYRLSEQTLPGRPQLPRDMSPQDLFVRVPILRTTIGYDRVFGDEIRLLLKWNGSRFQISATYESFENL